MVIFQLGPRMRRLPLPAESILFTEAGAAPAITIVTAGLHATKRHHNPRDL